MVIPTTGKSLLENFTKLQFVPGDRDELGGRMNRLFVLRNQPASYFGGYAVRVLLFCCSLGALAQSTASPANANAPLSVRATHVLGLENTKSNCDGALSIQDDTLQFRHGRESGEQVKIASVRSVLLGEESKEVGGLPMTLGKAAAPYGAGRVVSLFAHKNYDILTVEYVDSDGGVHGAIFQLIKGQGELARRELVDRGVSPGFGEDHATRHSTAEVTHENK